VPDRSHDWETALARAYRAAFAVLRDAPLAEEVAQHACYKALVKLDSFQGRCSFPRWVQSIAFRLALDVKKSPSWLELDPDAHPGSQDPERRAALGEATDAFLRCLAELTDRQQQIFLAKHLDGMKGAEIAAELSTREGTVWATLSQVAENLRRCLNRYGIDGEMLH
jgi:RNA polymerase sigma factor (sigma-70 family)